MRTHPKAAAEYNVTAMTNDIRLLFVFYSRITFITMNL